MSASAGTFRIGYRKERGRNSKSTFFTLTPKLFFKKFEKYKIIVYLCDIIE